jgi:WD40 repeat protein
MLFIDTPASAVVSLFIPAVHTHRVWDLSTGELKHTLKGHTERVRAVQVTPDGTGITSASDDGTLRWEERVASRSGQRNR